MIKLLPLLQKKPLRWQKYILGRHFFLRYFSGDSLAFAEQRKEKMIFFISSLAVAGLLISHKLYFPYLISKLTGKTSAQIWQEKTVFMTNFMILVGIVSVFTWNAMFPDRKDYQNLLCQPIRIGTILLAKFSSQLVFIALTTISVILPAALVISLYVGNVVKGSILPYLLVQFITLFLAGLFVYFWLFVIQGLLLLFLPHRFYQRVSIYFQLLLLGGLAILFTAFPRFFHDVLAAKRQAAGLGIWFSPLWFVGLGEKILGSRETLYGIHSGLALLGLVVPLVFYRSLFFLSYRKHLRVIPEASPRQTGGGPISLRNALSSLYLKSPVQKAIYDFVLRSLKSSRYHRFIMGIAILIPLSHALVHVIYSSQNPGFFLVENWTILSFSVIFIPFLVFGLRYAVTVPIETEANWVFKLYFPESEKYIQTGMRLAFWKSYFYPLLLLSFLLYNYAGGVPSAVLLTAYDAALLFLIQEWAFLHFQKIPFTCSSTFVNFNIKVFWPLCLFGFLSYVGFFTSFKKRLLGDAGFIMYLILGFLVVHLYNRVALRRLRQYDVPMAFDEDPEPVMLSLDIRH